MRTLTLMSKAPITPMRSNKDRLGMVIDFLKKCIESKLIRVLSKVSQLGHLNRVKVKHTMIFNST